MKPTTAYEWACYNAARHTAQIYGGMKQEEIAEYLAGKYDRPVADTLALIQEEEFRAQEEDLEHRYEERVCRSYEARGQASLY